MNVFWEVAVGVPLAFLVALAVHLVGQRLSDKIRHRTRTLVIYSLDGKEWRREWLSLKLADEGGLAIDDPLAVAQRKGLVVAGGSTAAKLGRGAYVHFVPMMLGQGRGILGIELYPLGVPPLPSRPTQ